MTPAGESPNTLRSSSRRRYAAGEFHLSFPDSGRGSANICNAVLSGLAACKGMPPFKVYTEVLQDAMLDLIASGKSPSASATALTLSDQKLKLLLAACMDG